MTINYDFVKGCNDEKTLEYWLLEYPQDFDWNQLRGMRNHTVVKETDVILYEDVLGQLLK